MTVFFRGSFQNLSDKDNDKNKIQTNTANKYDTIKY